MSDPQGAPVGPPWPRTVYEVFSKQGWEQGRFTHLHEALTQAGKLRSGEVLPADDRPGQQSFVPGKYLHPYRVARDRPIVVTKAVEWDYYVRHRIVVAEMALIP